MSDERLVLERSRKDPEWFCREVLGCDPWPKQVEIMESVRDNPETDVPSCHASGKSWTAARIVLWFTACHAPSIVITTAPTDRQMRGILWKEIRSAHAAARYPLGGTMLTTRWEIEPDWYAWGFTAPDWDPNRFQGFHAPHVLVVEDEAAGISRAIDEQIDGILSGGHARRLKIGNPVEPESSFRDSCDNPDVATIPISAFDTPNFTAFGITPADIASGEWLDKQGGPDAPLPNSNLISPAWVAARYRAWGEDSSPYISRVLGRFPPTVEGAYYAELLVKADDEKRIGNVPYEPQLPVHTAWDLGIARGADSMAIWLYQTAGREVRVIDYIGGSGEGLPFYVAELQRRNFVYGRHTAPHDIAVKELGTGRSRMEVAAELGIRFEVAPKLSISDGINAVRMLLPRCWFDATKCAEGLKALRNYRRDRNDRTGELKEAPLHNWASHPADAFRMLAVGIDDRPKQDRPRVDTNWIV